MKYFSLSCKALLDIVPHAISSIIVIMKVSHTESKIKHLNMTFRLNHMMEQPSILPTGGLAGVLAGVLAAWYKI